MDERLPRVRGTAGGIFICYRREDSGHAGRLYDHLTERFPRRPFLDVTDIATGADFVDAIERAIASSSALIVVIGRGWLETAGEDGARAIDNPRDFVRIEIAAALRRGIPVLPVLLPGANMPSAEQLPRDISALATRQAREVRDAEFGHDAGRIGDALAHLLGAGRSRQRRRVMVGVATAVVALSATFSWYAYGSRSDRAQPDEGGKAPEIRPSDEAPRAAESQGASTRDGQTPSTADLAAGVWVAVAPYYSPDPGGEWAFELEPAGSRLLGTVWGWDGTRPLLEGSADGDWVSFRTVWPNRPTYAGVTTYRDWWTDYRGRVFPDSIAFVLQRDDGASYRFVAYRRQWVPRADEFTVSPDTVTRGEPVDLCYRVRWTVRARIDPGIGPIDPARGACVTAHPADSTDYTLTIVAASGLMRRTTTTVIVLPAMDIAARPAPTDPADGDTVDSNRITLTWAALPGATRYSVEMVGCDGADCVEPTDTSRNTIDYGTSWTFGITTGSGTYRWRVRGIDRKGRQSSPSAWRTMIVR
jgi:hypothetical protein